MPSVEPGTPRLRRTGRVPTMVGSSSSRDTGKHVLIKTLPQSCLLQGYAQRTPTSTMMTINRTARCAQGYDRRAKHPASTDALSP